LARSLVANQQTKKPCQPNEVHAGVYCDGCSFDPESKRQASLAGHINHRGWIRGIRYKSDTVHDFDLCESCRGSGKFPDDSYGPFQELKGESRPQHCGRHHHHRHHCHGRQQATHQRECAATEPDRSEKNAKPVITPRVDEVAKQDGWVAVPLTPTVEDPFVKWNEQLALLQSLGFVNSETYISLLEEEKGDMERVVNRIVRRDL
jgi:hypothetical protein